MIVVVDYNMGNMASIRNALEFLKVDFIISRDLEEIKKATKLILPGVGSFRKAMENLARFDLIGALNDKVMIQKTPVLGICLGMQLLGSCGIEDSETGTPTPGLGWISGEVNKISPIGKDFRVPHMGFNGIKLKQQSSLLEGIVEDSHFYFVHSYHFQATNQEDIFATTDYESDLVAIIGRQHILGVQFHPEKSQQVGLKLLRNFVEKI